MFPPKSLSVLCILLGLLSNSELWGTVYSSGCLTSQNIQVMREAVFGRYNGKFVDAQKVKALKPVNRSNSPVEFLKTASLLSSRESLANLPEGVYLGLVLRNRKNGQLTTLVSAKFPHEKVPEDMKQLHASHRSMLRYLEPQLGKVGGKFDVIAGGEFERMNIGGVLFTNRVSNGTGTFSLANSSENLVIFIQMLATRNLEIDHNTSFQNYATGYFPDPHDAVGQIAEQRLGIFTNTTMSNYVNQLKIDHNFLMNRFPYLGDPMHAGHLDVTAIFVPALRALEVIPGPEGQLSKSELMERELLQTIDFLQKQRTDGFAFVAAMLINAELPASFLRRNIDMAIFLMDGSPRRGYPEELADLNRRDRNYFP